MANRVVENWLLGKSWVNTKRRMKRGVVRLQGVRKQERGVLSERKSYWMDGSGYRLVRGGWMIEFVVGVVIVKWKITDN